jgi:hypothetical protein
MILTGEHTTIDCGFIYLMQRRTSVKAKVNYCLVRLRGGVSLIIADSDGATEFPGLDHYVDPILYKLLVEYGVSKHKEESQ